MKEPRWVSQQAALAANERLVGLFGGMAAGVRDENLFQAALARPLNKWHFEEPRPDVFDLAAAYAFALSKGHIFLDGNKRTAHAIAYAFLMLNGLLHSTSEPEIVRTMIAIADGSMGERDLAVWFRETSTKVQ
jgi:death-on-curing protein